MIDFSFVILHYQNIKDTVNCINSIKQLERPKNLRLNLIIIDNKSPNNSGLELKKKYKNDPDIKVILLEKNYGFSVANNIGYEQAKKNKSDLILMSNNDILIKDKKFLKKLLDIYKSKSEKYQIFCPDIINRDGCHQNPLRVNFISLKKAYKNYFYKKFISMFLCLPFFNKVVYKYETKRTKMWMEKYYSKSEEKIISDFVPFGAFIIFSKKWIETEDVAFPSDTFMYAEEDFLSLYCSKKQYNLLYCPELVVNHLEGQSVKKMNNNGISVMKFKLKNETLALKKYIKFYKKMNGGD